MGRECRGAKLLAGAQLILDSASALGNIYICNLAKLGKSWRAPALQRLVLVCLFVLFYFILFFLLLLIMIFPSQEAAPFPSQNPRIPTPNFPLGAGFDGAFPQNSGAERN